MSKEKLLAIINVLLKTDSDLRFLLKLTEEELQTLVACIRDQVEQFEG
jgi:hypothetical protein